MAEIIDISVSAKVKNGPNVTFVQALNVDAYDKLDVVIPTGGVAKTIQLLPPGTESVHLLMIKSSRYSDDANEITYQVNGAGTDINLDTPQSFVGLGSLASLDDAADPASLVFENNLPEDVTVQILVGRKVSA